MRNDDHPAGTMNSTSPGTVAAWDGTPAGGADIVFFDGICGLCNRAVDFILRHDHVGQMRLAPLQGETAAEILPEADRTALHSLVLWTPAGIYRRSAAVVRILARMGGAWPVVGSLMWVVPRPIRDGGYRVVARYRYRWFGQKSSCRLPTPAEVGRLLP